MNEIGISVIIPVYNNEAYLRECVNSVLEQDYKNYEIVLVDDGSSDKSGEICDEYQGVKNFIVIHQKNQGQISARLKGVKESHKDIIVFLDSDDRLMKGCLRTISDIFNRTKSDCVIYNLCDMDNANSIQPINCGYSIEVKKNVREIMMRVLLNQDLNSMCRKAVKRGLTNSVDLEDFYHVRMGEDLIHTIKVLEKCNSVAFVDLVLYEYRNNPSSVSQTLKRMGKIIDYSVEEFIITYLKNQKELFDDSDIERYLQYVYNLLYHKIIRIVTLKLEGKQIIALLSDLWDTRFYQSHLMNYKNNSSGRKERIILSLFRHKNFKLLLALGAVYARR